MPPLDYVMVDDRLEELRGLCWQEQLTTLIKYTLDPDLPKSESRMMNKCDAIMSDMVGELLDNTIVSVIYERALKHKVMAEAIDVVEYIENLG